MRTARSAHVSASSARPSARANSDRRNAPAGWSAPSPSQARTSSRKAPSIGGPAQEATLGLSPLFDATLVASNAKRKQYDAARGLLVDELVKVADPSITPAELAAREAPIVVASQAVAARDAELLLVELGYYLGLYQATQQAGSTNLARYIACIESPATQAMKGNGGFDALGGGTCEP